MSPVATRRFGLRLAEAESRTDEHLPTDGGGTSWIAVADEDEISVQAAVAVESAGGFYGGAELVVGADQGERSGGGEKLGVRSGREELVGVLGVQRFARRLAGG